MAEQQPSASLSPEAAPSAASTKTTTAPAAVPLATDEDAAERAEHMGSYAPPLASLPTLKDIRRDPNLLEARRTRSRTLSMSQDPGQARLGRTLSRVLEPAIVGPMGSVSPADADMSGLPPPRDSAEAERTESRINAECEANKSDKDWEVHFKEGDPLNPKNWGVWYRWWLTAAGGILVLNATFASSAPSGVIPIMIQEFGFSREVAILMIALFVAGYCVGPLLWGPASEIYGRRPLFIVTFFCYACFQIGCALSKNTASILVFRFLGGTFAAAPLTNAGGLIADIWDSDRRGIAFAFFSLAPFAGPAIGPMVSGFMSTAGQPWQNLFWVLFAFSGACFVLILVGIPETYCPKILASEAKRRRKHDGEDRWYAPLERSDTSAKARIKDILVKPFKMLALEPMLLLITLFMSFVYGIIYLLFEAYPIVFTAGHGFNEGITGLMFLPIFIGGSVATITYIIFFNPRYVAAHHRYSSMTPPRPVPPEVRLEMAVFGGPMLVIALFWFGWTSYPSISWWSPALAGGLIGWATIYLFLAMFNFDTYLFAAASALAANTVCRSTFGAGFPLFASQMFETLNPRIASTVLGSIAILLAPIPIIFIKYGPTLRQRSRFAPSMPPAPAPVQPKDE